LTTIYAHENGTTRLVDRVEPDWLRRDSGVWVWVDMVKPGADEIRMLTDVFHFHDLAIEDAVSEIHHPKVESYGDFLYVILHGIDFSAREHRFRTRDVDFFLNDQYLVTIHGGVSRSIGKVGEICTRNNRVLGEGPAALMYRIIDAMVDNYRPEVEKLQQRLDALEKEVFEQSKPNLARRILDYKRDISSLRRVVSPQRDVVGRLGRREFSIISESISFRYRDVYDHLVRLADEGVFLQDRISSLLEAHLSMVSNQLNGVMKVLTVIATIFMPLTVLTGMYGMNVDLPHLPGGVKVQFWWIVAMMLVISGLMLWMFRRWRWI
jgi:magnesium transporter